MEIDAFWENENLKIIEEKAIMLRAVHPNLRNILHASRQLNVNVVISSTGFNELSASFLSCWKGVLNIRCDYDCDEASPWFRVFLGVVKSKTCPNFGSLSLSVTGTVISHPLRSLNRVAFQGHRFVKSIHLNFHGKKQDFMRARRDLVRLGQRLPLFVDITIEETAWGVSEYRHLMNITNTRVKFIGLSLR